MFSRFRMGNLQEKILPYKSSFTLVSPRRGSSCRQIWRHGSPLMCAALVYENPLLGGGTQCGTGRPGSRWRRWGVALNHESQLVLGVDWPDFWWFSSIFFFWKFLFVARIYVKQFVLFRHYSLTNELSELSKVWSKIVPDVPGGTFPSDGGTAAKDAHRAGPEM